MNGMNGAIILRDPSPSPKGYLGNRNGVQPLDVRVQCHYVVMRIVLPPIQLVEDQNLSCYIVNLFSAKGALFPEKT